MLGFCMCVRVCVCVCVHVCVCVYMFVFVYVYMCVYVCTCLCLCMCTCVCICAHVCEDVWMCVCEYVLCICVPNLNMGSLLDRQWAWGPVPVLKYTSSCMFSLQPTFNLIRHSFHFSDVHVHVCFTTTDHHSMGVRNRSISCFLPYI